MKKWKLFMVCCLLVGSMGLFAACGTNDNNTNDTQNTVMDTNANDAMEQITELPMETTQPTTETM